MGQVAPFCDFAEAAAAVGVGNIPRCRADLPMGSAPGFVMLSSAHGGAITEWNMVSLHEQLLKAGLVDKNKVKQAAHSQQKQKKTERRTGEVSVDEARAAALELQRKNAEKAREANAQRDAAARQKAILAQIAQLLANNRQPKAQGGQGDIAYHFTHAGKVERIYVSNSVREHLTAGRLVIVVMNGAVELVPRVIADKIAERDPALVVRVNKASTQVDEDDPYAAYQIPDDLMW
jgi:uncharacterized protein YaiL (DUF2058 family)